MTIKTTLRRAFQKGFAGNITKHVAYLERTLAERPDTIHANSESPERFDILMNSMKVEGDVPPLPGFPKSVPHILSSFYNIRRSILELDDNPQNHRTTITTDELAELETFIKSVGVDEIGYAPVPEQFIFRDKAILHKNAIVLVMEMSKERMEKAPNKDTAVMVHETYNHLGIASNKIARYLREKGFSAHSGHPLMGLALYPPLGQSAGLGWRGMHGLLITPRFGPRVRLAAVFTDIENLPFAEHTDHAWIEDYCERCKLCQKQCPGDAVLEEPILHESGQITCTDSDKCLPYFVKLHGCSICIKVCPFNRAGYERLHHIMHLDAPVPVA